MKRPSKTKRTSARRRPAPSPLVATLSETASLLGVSESSVSRMLDHWKDGKLVERRRLPRLVGVRRVLVPRVAIANYLAEQVAQRNAAAS